MKSLPVALIACGIGAVALHAQVTGKPKAGFVPDAETAIKIAVAVWEPIYGRRQIESEKPFRAYLKENGIWFVSGSLPPNFLGGVAEAEIAKDDGRVLRVFHSE